MGKVLSKQFNGLKPPWNKASGSCVAGSSASWRPEAEADLAAIWTTRTELWSYSFSDVLHNDTTYYYMWLSMPSLLHHSSESVEAGDIMRSTNVQVNMTFLRRLDPEDADCNVCWNAGAAHIRCREAPESRSYATWACMKCEASCATKSKTGQRILHSPASISGY
jgi:hypothetical protein